MRHLKTYHLLLLGLILLMPATHLGAAPMASNPLVNFATSKGDITVVLYPKEAPITVKNFLRYAKEGKYNNTIFHRVIKGFIIQGGGYNPKYKLKKTYPAIINEADNDLSNIRGTIAMARREKPNSATNQFFFNVVDNRLALDPKAQIHGYTVFGKVIKGMEVVDAISKLRTTKAQEHIHSAPSIPVVIKNVTVANLPAESAKQPQFSPKKIMKTSDIRSYTPINPYEENINKKTNSWREALKLRMYAWFKPLFPGYAVDTYKPEK